MVAIDEAERIRDRVPHAVNRTAGRALERPLELCEPLCERDVVELADHIHSAVKVDERAYDWAGAEAQRVGELVAHADLLSARKRLQPRHGRADREAEVERAHAAAVVDERVRVLLQPQQVIRARALHDAKKVVVAAEEDVQAHLDVVAVLVQPAAHLATHKGSQLEYFHVVARVSKVHGRDHAGQTRANDTNLELRFAHHARPILRAATQRLVEEGAVADLRLGAIRRQRRRLGDHRGTQRLHRVGAAHVPGANRQRGGATARDQGHQPGRHVDEGRRKRGDPCSRDLGTFIHNTPTRNTFFRLNGHSR